MFALESTIMVSLLQFSATCHVPPAGRGAEKCSIIELVELLLEKNLTI